MTNSVAQPMSWLVSVSSEYDYLLIQSYEALTYLNLCVHMCVLLLTGTSLYIGVGVGLAIVILGVVM